MCLWVHLFLKVSILLLIKENEEPCSKPPQLENDLPQNLWGSALRNHTTIWETAVSFTHVSLDLSLFLSPAKSLTSCFCLTNYLKYLFSVLLRCLKPTSHP